MPADKVLFSTVSILIGISILLSYSLSPYITILFHLSEFHFVIRQFSFAMLSIFIMWFLSTLDPDKWLKPIGFGLFFGSSVLMLLMLILPESIVPAIGGAKRWIKVFGFSLAPVEFFKIGFIYFLAWSFSRKMDYHGGRGLKYEWLRFLPYGVIFTGAIFIIGYEQKDLGQSMVLTGTMLILLIFVGSSYKFFLSILALIVVGIVLLISTASHRIGRIQSWWSTIQDTVLDLAPSFIEDWLRIPVEVIPYQIGHSINAIYNGALFGEGVGNGTFKLGFLSEVHTDFILSGLMEEFGFIGIFIVVSLFLVVLLRIFKVASRTEDTTIYLFTLGMGLILSIAFLVNAYGISGITPIKGISVPFLSYGGSSILGSSIAVGMVLMASKK
ncbi:MAG: FtsW/RodA/SpoVE family cell cycle protein, partial [Verrucomicrobiota bacterium]|nr:FtsW/RodA/SpoVE family cell cycle protein [Verrucomicrobiota bacterium]